MSNGPTNRRQRNRGSNNGRRNNPQQQRTQVYDSNGPDVRIRGTAYQVAEKYMALAKDAMSAGDRIMSESYYQHAEHYVRIITEFNGTFDLSRINREVGDFVDDAAGNNTQSDAHDIVTVNIVEKTDLSLPASILGISGSPKQQQQAPAVREVEVVE